jgi:hypothetical protein
MEKVETLKDGKKVIIRSLVAQDLEALMNEEEKPAPKEPP